MARTILPKDEFVLVIRAQNQSAVIPEGIRKTGTAIQKLKAVGDSSAAGINFTAVEQYRGSQGPAKTMCVLQFGPAAHRDIKSKTQLSDHMVKAILIMHESAHCLLGQKISDGIEIKKSTGDLPAENRKWFPPALLALMTLAQNGENVSAALEKMIRVRSHDVAHDQAHDSSIGLRKLQTFLADVGNISERQTHFKSLSRGDLCAIVLELMHEDRSTWLRSSET